MIDVPYFSQWDADGNARKSDCGQTCVKMVAAQYGIKTSINALPYQSLPSGITSALDIVRNLDKLGLKSTAVYRTPEAVQDGDICLVIYGELNGQQDRRFKGLHWLVYLGTQDGKVLTNDPNFYAARRDEGASKVYSLRDWNKAFLGSFVHITGSKK